MHTHLFLHFDAPMLGKYVQIDSAIFTSSFEESKYFLDLCNSSSKHVAVIQMKFRYIIVITTIFHF